MLPRRRLIYPQLLPQKTRLTHLLLYGCLFIIGYVLGLLCVQIQLTNRNDGGGQNCLGHLAAETRKPSQEAERLHDLAAVKDTILMIGVMTTRRNLVTRASAIYRTWGQQVPGVVMFYIGEQERRMKGQFHSDALRLPRNEKVEEILGMPVVRLRGVTDQSYPPQLKCFAMLTHMQSHMAKWNLSWYVRADDDVYIRPHKLSLFLQGIDASRPLYVGQAGVGVASEGKLGLQGDQPYCMGGPGVALSSSAMRQLVPHLPECAGSVVTRHEDTELGRCVLQHLNISCTRSSQMANLFYHDYSKNTYTQRQLPKEVWQALTLHPVKAPTLMRRLHMLLRVLDLYDLQDRQAALLRDIDVTSGSLAGRTQTATHQKRPKEPSGYNRLSVVEDYMYSIQKQLTEISGTFMSNVNATTVERDLLVRDNPIFPYVCAVKKGKRQCQGIKPHGSLYGQIHAATEAFLKVYVRVKPGHIHAQYESRPNLVHGFQHVVTLRFSKSYRSILLSSRFGELEWREVDEMTYNLNRLTPTPTPSDPREHGAASSWPRLCFLVPLAGRHQAYVRFLRHLTSSARQYQGEVHLHMALFHDKAGDSARSLNISSRFDNIIDVTVTEMNTSFSRAVALHTLVEKGGFHDDTILVFLDVDLVVGHKFLQRVALNVRRGTAYFPVMFSKYWPKTVCWNKRGCRPDSFNFDRDHGLWREFSYGPAAVTAVDYRKTSGFNTLIVGWGKEDVDFFDRCLRRGLRLFRAADPGLVHEYHVKRCDPGLRRDQLAMCRRSRESLAGSTARLAQIAYSTKLADRHRRRHRHRHRHRPRPRRRPSRAAGT